MGQGPRLQTAQKPCTVHPRQEEWFTFLLNHGRSERTKWTYENALRWFGEWLVAVGIVWAQVKRGTVEQWIADLRAAGRHPKSIQSRVGAVKGFFAWLEDEGHIDKSPLKGLRPIKVPESLPRVHNRTEIDLMFAAAKTTREKVVLEILYAAGVRRQGLLDIRLQDIDLKARTIRIHHKGGKERIVIITPSAVLAILRWLPQRSMIAANLAHDTGHLMIGRQGPLSGQRILDIVHTVADRANVPRSHVHAWRHSALSHLLEGGMSLRTIQKQAGHSSISTTAKYLHVATDRMREEYDRTHPRAKAPPLP